MDYMFWNAAKFNDPSISKWDVSNVTRLYGMFYGVTVFNQSINDWNKGSKHAMDSLPTLYILHVPERCCV
jgi:hypothetical protein